MILAAVALAAGGNRAAANIIEAAKMDKSDEIAIATAIELVDSIGKVEADRAVSKTMIAAVVAAVAGIEDRATVTVAAVDKNVAQGEVIDAFEFRQKLTTYLHIYIYILDTHYALRITYTHH